MAKSQKPVHVKDVIYVVKFFDENWNEIPNTELGSSAPEGLVNILRSWRETRYANIGVDQSTLCSYARAVACGIELCYGEV